MSPGAVHCLVATFFRRVFLAAALAVALPAVAQDFPTRLVKIIVPFPAGSGLDRVAHVPAEKLQARGHQTVLVENRPGFGGNLGTKAAYDAPADGYTLLVVPPSPLVINKALYPQLDYDPDVFAPVSLLASLPNVLLVPTGSSSQSVTQLVARAKAAPNVVNYALQGAGTTPHLAAELFQSMAGIEMVHVPYKGVAPALTDLMGAHVDTMFADLASALPLIRAGKVLALAVGSEKRTPLIPEVPALGETLPGFFSTLWYGVVAPPKTPVERLTRLSSAVTEVMMQPDVVARLHDFSIEVNASGSQQMARFMQQERERWGHVIRESGVKVE